MKQSGFTLVEALVVVAIISVLVAIATPPCLRHIQRARASESVATMALIRQALRDYHINHGAYFDIASNNIQNDPTAGVEIDVGVTQYFSNHSYTVDATSPSSTNFTSPDVVDFLISVDGSQSVACGSNNCAINNTAVSNFRLEMDNSGRIFISLNSGTNWSTY